MTGFTFVQVQLGRYYPVGFNPVLGIELHSFALSDEYIQNIDFRSCPGPGTQQLPEEISRSTVRMEYTHHWDLDDDT